MFNDNFSKCASVPSIYLFAEVNDTGTLQRSVIPRGEARKSCSFFHDEDDDDDDDDDDARSGRRLRCRNK